MSLTAKKKVLVLGATGFIGRNIVRDLAHKDEYEVYASFHNKDKFDLPNVSWVYADLLNPRDVEQVIHGMDIIIQAAATTSGAKDIVHSPAQHVTDNAVMNSYIFRQAFEQKIDHVIFFSCTVMYESGQTPLKEEDFNGSIHEKYFGVGWTKVYLEKMAEFFASHGKTRFTVLRHSNIYGPYDKFDLAKGHVFASSLLKVFQAQQRNRSHIEAWGDGSDVRDFLHVEDLLHFLHVVLNHHDENNFQLFNLGSSEPITIKKLLEKMIENTTPQLRVTWNSSMPSIGTSIVIDSEKAHKLGWKNKITIEEGIRKTWKWLQENQEYLS